MKKIAGLLLLTAAVILTAGCITTTDPIVGNWQTKEPIQYEDYGYNLSYMLTFEKDGTGEMIDSYSYTETDYYSPILWEKTSENTYLYEMLIIFTISEDGKTITDDYHNTYNLAEGDEMFEDVN